MTSPPLTASSGPTSPHSQGEPYSGILRVERLSKVFAVGQADGREKQRALNMRSRIAAVDSVHLEVGRAETVGVVGESGSGKTTLARCVMRLTKPTAGAVYFEGAEVSKLHGQALRTFRQRAQIVFQDPFASIDQRFTALRAISEPLLVHRICPPGERYDRARLLMRQVGLREELLNRYRHELSGGEAQRVTIARALATGPRFLVLDEPTSALDASARLHVISLLKELRSSLGMTFLVISHDLNTIRYLCERVVVMYRGRIVEEGRSEVILKIRVTRYTRALITALPVIPGTVRRVPRAPWQFGGHALPASRLSAIQSLPVRDRGVRGKEPKSSLKSCPGIGSHAIGSWPVSSILPTRHSRRFATDREGAGK